MKYRILIEEVVSETFEVEAKTKEEALKIASHNYRECEFVLEPGNLESARMTLCDDDNDKEWYDIF